MGFISFNETYYSRRLEALERGPLTGGDVYEVRQLLKVLDDLADEGYTALNHRMERDFSCLTRLCALLRRAGEAPFPVDHTHLPETSYSEGEHELTALLDRLLAAAGERDIPSDNPFLKSILDYCRWIGADADTAYVFLLRDALLPYLYCRSRGRENLYPWLLSRRSLADIAGAEGVDDEIRLPIYEALETGHIDFPAFRASCKAGILPVLDRHPELKRTLLALLASVRQERIVVVESGYAGTLPMLLSALDDRVTFPMYTTAPFLYETYREHIFCRRYEDIRRFETLYSQDRLLRYSSFRDGKFYVRLADDPAITERALAEIRYFLP